MKLNKGKCEALLFGGRSKVKFHHQEAVNTVEQAKYLGCTLNKHNDTTKELRGRIRDATITLKRMHTFWSHSNCSIRFKLQVLKAVIFAKVLFGLESAELTDTALRLLDVFHLRGLRKILHMKTTFIDRANTNAEVYKRANEQLKQKDKIKPLREIFMERKQNIYGKDRTTTEDDEMNHKIQGSIQKELQALGRVPG